MKIRDLMDLTLKEILEKYCTIHNLECDNYYGVFKVSDVDQIFEEYNIEEYEIAFEVESLLNYVFRELREDDKIRDYDTLVRIVNNLGISKKE